MGSITIDPTAISRVRVAVKSSDFQRNNNISVMMHHIVDGAKTVEDCVDKSWPEWFVMSNNFLFDADSDAENEQAARENFALRIAEYASEPVNYDRAHDLFRIRRLETSDHSSLKTLGALDGEYTLQTKAISSALDALKRREKGQVVSMRPVIHDLHFAAKTENLAAHHATLAANRTPAGCAESTARSGLDRPECCRSQYLSRPLRFRSGHWHSARRSSGRSWHGIRNASQLSG